jgi:hypothetical protein
VANLGVARTELQLVLIAGMEAQVPLGHWPRGRTQKLVAERYSLAAWNQQR